MILLVMIVVDRKLRSAAEEAIQMILQAKDHAIVAAHRLEQSGAVEKPAVSCGHAGLLDVDQVVVQKNLIRHTILS